MDNFEHIEGLNFTKSEFNWLDDPLSRFHTDLTFDNYSQQFNYEEIFTKILLGQKFDVDTLIKNINNDNNIVRILRHCKTLTIKQRLYLFNKLVYSHAIFSAVLTFTKEELYSFVKLPDEYSTNSLTNYIHSSPCKNIRSVLICYLYLYPSKKKLSKEKTKFIFRLLECSYNSYCYPLITTEQFLSNFSKSTRDRLFIKGFKNINVKLFSYINKIPDELYEKSLKNLLKGFVPLDILLYGKCFQKDYKLFLKDSDVKDFYRLVYDTYIDGYHARKDILTIEQFRYCIHYFSQKDSKEFLKLLPNFIKYECDEDRKAILNSYILLEELKNE